MNRVVYFSRGGNTKKLAEAVAKGAFLLANRGRPNGEDLKQAEAFAKEIRGGRP